MKITEYKNKDDIRVLAGMVINKIVLSHVSSVWTSQGLLSTEHTNIIGSICVDYYRKHEKAPRKGLATLIRDWAVGKDNETVQLVDTLATNLLENYDTWKEKLNHTYEIEFISKHTTIIKAKKLIQDLESAIELERVDKILELNKNFNPVEIGKDSIKDVVRDSALIDRAFEETEQPLITYTGKLRALGQFLGDAFAPGHLIGIAAPEKRGKTSILLEFAWHGHLSKKRVLFIEAGDMTDTQLAKRIYSREANKPIRAREWPLVINYPRGMKVSNNQRHMDFELKSFDTPLTREDAIKAMERFEKRKLMSSDCFFQLLCAPAGTLTVANIKSKYEDLAAKGWVADIIVVDYADLLTTSGYAKTDFRERTNSIWQDLKALTNEKNCCIITATQANRASYNATIITMSHVSEDKRKSAHVNGFMAINQNAEEKKDGVYRLSWMNNRNNDLDDNSCVYIAGTLALCKPAIISCWPKKVVDAAELEDD